jgi:hypothetical protein
MRSRVEAVSRACVAARCFAVRGIRCYFFVSLIVASCACGKTNYYISSSTGNNANNGTSSGTAWRTLDKIIYKTPAFQPGDSILFKRGDTFEGEISTTFTGTAQAPIVISAYGTGAKPIIYGDLTGRTWEAVSGRSGFYKTYVGYMVGSAGYEYYSGAWNVLHQVGGNITWSLSDPDSLKKYLDGFELSNYGPGSAGSDTVWIRTNDGNPPNVHIFREGNFAGGSYLVVRDLEIRNIWSAIKVYNVQHCTYRNLTTRNTMTPALFLVTHCQYCIVDSSQVDSASYTALYDYFGSHNTFRYNTVRNVKDGILGISKTAERCGIGLQTDTCAVVEYNTFDRIFDSGVDSYYCQGDTIRYNTVANTPGGIWLNGNNWVAQNNTVTSLSGGTGIDVTNHGPGQSTITNNTMINTGSGLRVDTRENNGTTVFSGNTITAASSNSLFDEFIVSGISSSNNTFIGLGKLSSQGKTYSTLAAFHSATGLETGSVSYSGPPTEASTAAPPLEYGLSQNYPNPFNPSTTIEFTVPNDGYASLEVFDALGREIMTLARGLQSRGRHRYQWNAEGKASGVYFYRFTSGTYTETRRMMLLR